MALDTVAGLFDRIQLNLGRGAHTTIVAMIPEWANLIQRELSRQGHWWWNFEENSASTLTAGTDTMTLPTDFLDEEFVFLRDTNGALHEVGLMDPLEYRQRYTDLTGTEHRGRPNHAFVRETDILFRPISDATYTIILGYWQQLADLVSGGSTNELLLTYPDVLEYGGTYKGFLYMQEYEDAKNWKDMYDAAARDMRIANNERQLPSEMVLSVRPGAGKSRLHSRVSRVGRSNYFPKGGY